MIESLQVNNFALIKEAHVDFKNNLNVLTGETGSGKSILLGSINLALGMRANKDIIRDENGEASVSISFNIKDNNIINFIKENDIDIEDNRLIIFRKITKDKNVIKINDKPCTLSKLREITEKLIDVYGQHDGEDLRKDNRHIEFLDEFIGNEVLPLKQNIIRNLDELRKIREKKDSFNLDEKMRLREIDILKYEIDELKNADIKENEEEELSEKYKVLSNSKNIVSSLTTAKSVLEEQDVNIAIREIKNASKYDKDLDNIYKGLLDVDSIISDAIKDLDKRIDSYEIDDFELNKMLDRLNEIRGILAKYDNSLEKANIELGEKTKRLEELIDYDNEKKKVEDEIKAAEKKVKSSCSKLSELRKKYINDFESKILNELIDLGFQDAKFVIDIKEKDAPTRDGIDDVIFLVSLNKGEKIKPLSEVASGGELSRIMLAIKTILSDSFGTETLIFDEIDAGISGITASKVAKKLNRIANHHQVILITHLPQIAAMADSHYVIEKKVIKDRTITSITELDNNGMIDEIGRLISSSGVLTDSVIANAKELKNNAIKEKK